MTRKLLPHFGQRIFMPLAGTRFSERLYGALQLGHWTFNMQNLRADTVEFPPRDA